MGNSFIQPKWRNRGKSSLLRFQTILPFIKNKSVLDIGCAVGYLRDNWLHQLIVENANNVVGIDIDQKAIDEIQTKYPATKTFFGDARNFDLQQQFDVVHAGELIEHIDDFHGFLQSAKKHLKQNGKLLLSTPNVECLNHPIYNLTGGLKVNAEHVCWFCDKTLTALLIRNGYEIVSVKFLSQPTYGVRKVFRSLLQLFPNRLSHPTLFVVAKPIAA